MIELDSALAPLDAVSRREIREVLTLACGSSDVDDQAAWVRAEFFDQSAHSVRLAPRYQRLEDTLTRVWRHLSVASSKRYARQVRPIVRAAAELERRQLSAAPSAPEEFDEPTVFGDWLVSLKLGAGGDGDAFLATHATSGHQATLKTPAGAELHVWRHLQHNAVGDQVSEWHTRLVRILEGDRPLPSLLLPRPSWIVREYADTSLWDTQRAMRAAGSRFPIEDALEVFGMACDVVAWLHARGVYRWSAHTRNVLRVNGQWQLADLGRSLILVDEKHWATAWLREVMRLGWSLPSADEVGALRSPSSWWSFVDRLRWAAAWSHRTNGFWPRDPGLEDRLRRDDSATLAGLLCQVLSGTRFDHFLRALRPPLCTARYTLTGDEAVDRRLSQVLNRAWLGDAGGVLGVAYGQDGGGYARPQDLLADVQSALS